jgi:hypothetical protein
VNALVLVVLVLLIGPIFASADVFQKNESCGSASCPEEGCGNCFYFSLEPCNSGALSEVLAVSTLQPLDPKLCKSKLWIACVSGPLRLSEISVPLHSWTALELVPGAEGYVTLIQRLPSGSLKSSFKGYVYPGHRYRAWFFADASGSSELWYRVGWQESNKVSLSVWC